MEESNPCLMIDCAVMVIANILCNLHINVFEKLFHKSDIKSILLSNQKTEHEALIRRAVENLDLQEICESIVFFLKFSFNKNECIWINTPYKEKLISDDKLSLGLFSPYHSIHIPKFRSKIRKHPYHTSSSKRSPNVQIIKISFKISEDVRCLINVHPSSIHKNSGYIGLSELKFFALRVILVIKSMFYSVSKCASHSISAPSRLALNYETHNALVTLHCVHCNKNLNFLTKTNYGRESKLSSLYKLYFYTINAAPIFEFADRYFMVFANDNTVSKNGGFLFKDFINENTITCKYKDKGKERKKEEHYQCHLLESPSYWTYSFCHHSLSDE